MPASCELDRWNCIVGILGQALGLEHQYGCCLVWADVDTAGGGSLWVGSTLQLRDEEERACQKGNISSDAAS